MTWKKRCELKPGEMFVTPDVPWTQRYWQDVFVVIDDLHEIGFWRGGLFCHGDVASSREVLVL